MNSAAVFLEVLVVFRIFPVTAPNETMFLEETVAKVVFCYLVFEVVASVAPTGTASWLYRCFPASVSFHTWVVKWVYVYCHSCRMPRQSAGAGNGPVTEAGGVVGSHGSLVFGIIIVNEPYALYRILSFVESAEYVEKVIGYGFVAYNLALSCFSLAVNMQHT